MGKSVYLPYFHTFRSDFPVSIKTCIRMWCSITVAALYQERFNRFNRKNLSSVPYEALINQQYLLEVVVSNPSMEKTIFGKSFLIKRWKWILMKLYRGINVAQFRRKSIWSLLEPHMSFKKVIQGSPRQIWLRFSLGRGASSALLRVWWLAAPISRAVATHEHARIYFLCEVSRNFRR